MYNLNLKMGVCTFTNRIKYFDFNKRIILFMINQYFTGVV